MIDILHTRESMTVDWRQEVTEVVGGRFVFTLGSFLPETDDKQFCGF